MKILYCLPSLYHSGGMERILTEKANWLVEHGYDVDILTTDQNNRAPFFKLSDKINLIHLDINFSEHYNANPLKKYFLHYKRLYEYKSQLQKIAQQNAYDIIVSLCGKEIEFLTSLRCKAKKVAELHFSQNFKSQFIESNHEGALYRIIGKWLTRSFVRSTKNLDALVVLTKDDMQQWLKTNKNIHQIYNFIPTSNEYSQRTHTINKRCVAVGRLDAQKGFDLLIKSWQQVVKAAPNWKLEIFGIGEWKDKLSKEISDSGLDGKVILRGQSNNIGEELGKSDVFILSSRYEGFPMVLLEALKAGLPIVAYDCKTGPKEIVEDGQNGYLIPNGDVDEMANTIIRLTEHPEHLETFGSRSLEICDKFEKESIMQQWDKLFKAI